MRKLITDPQPHAARRRWLAAPSRPPRRAGLSARARHRHRGRTDACAGRAVGDLLRPPQRRRQAWGRWYRELAYEAVAQASADFALGSHGGGHGATTVNLKGGLGSASTVT